MSCMGIIIFRWWFPKSTPFPDSRLWSYQSSSSMADLTSPHIGACGFYLLRSRKRAVLTPNRSYVENIQLFEYFFYLIKKFNLSFCSLPKKCTSYNYQVLKIFVSRRESTNIKQFVNSCLCYRYFLVDVR